MSITSQAELSGVKKAGEVVGSTLRAMREYARPGMSTKELDDYGSNLLRSAGAYSAPGKLYGFPGCACISLNHEVAHGIPSYKKILREGDLINIDVSAEVEGYYSDNGGSFVLGKDIHNLSSLVETSRRALTRALHHVRSGARISDIGLAIETEARKGGYKVIRNLVGHGIGRSLHEDPHEIPCFQDRANNKRFRKNSVVAIETFISTSAQYAYEESDGWTYVTKDGSYVAQHEHTIIVTDHQPIIVTASNEILHH
jgi:methionyl aminopeptidase